eukprot:jgi/Botrbrau1/6778/Bobra.0057s0014.1
MDVFGNLLLIDARTGQMFGQHCNWASHWLPGRRRCHCRWYCVCWVRLRSIRLFLA